MSKQFVVNSRVGRSGPTITLNDNVSRRIVESLAAQVEPALWGEAHYLIHEYERGDYPDRAEDAWQRRENAIDDIHDEVRPIAFDLTWREARALHEALGRELQKYKPYRRERRAA